MYECLPLECPIPNCDTTTLRCRPMKSKYCVICSSVLWHQMGTMAWLCIDKSVVKEPTPRTLVVRPSVRLSGCGRQGCISEQMCLVFGFDVDYNILKYKTYHHFIRAVVCGIGWMVPEGSPLSETCFFNFRIPRFFFKLLVYYRFHSVQAIYQLAKFNGGDIW